MSMGYTTVPNSKPPSSLPMFPFLRAALVALVVSAVSISADPGLTVHTSTANVEVDDGLDKLKVTATVINTGDETLKLLNNPRGILNAFPENSFTITNAAGSRPMFNGAKVGSKRLVPWQI